MTKEVPEVPDLGFVAAPANGRGVRVVIAKQADGDEIFRDTFNTDSASQRNTFFRDLADRLEVDPAALQAKYEGEVLKRADAADVEAERLAAEQATKPAEDLQGRPLQLAWPEPWPEPVKLADVLDEVVAAIRRHVVVTPEQADAVAIWIAWTYVHHHCDIAPPLGVTSPTKQCGKSTLLDVIHCLSARAIVTNNITSAAVFRTIERAAPLTLIFDEADTFLPGKEELRGILDSGHRRELAFVVRVVGEDMEPRQFSTFSAKAFGCIGKLPPTLEDRAIPIRMERRRKEDKITRLTKKWRLVLRELTRRIFTATDSEELRAALGETEPAMPPLGSDRARDNWEPLIIVADYAGRDWPARARRAAVVIAGELDGEDINERFIRDVASVFHDGEDELSATEIAERLVLIEESPWATYNRGRPISPDQAGRRLRGFGLTVKRDKKSRKYSKDDIFNVAAKYSPAQGENSVIASPAHENPLFDQGFEVTLGENEKQASQDPKKKCHPVNADSTDTYVTGDTGDALEGGKRDTKHNNVNLLFDQAALEEKWVFD